MKYLFLSIAFVFIFKLRAQNEIILNQYSQNIFAINSSFSALAPQAEANLYYKKLWSGFSDAPEYFHFTLGAPVRNTKTGVGLTASSQQLGLFSYFNVQGSFSYKVKLNENNLLSFGLQAGIKRLQIDFSKLNAEDMSEFAGFPQQQASTLPTADFSVSYKNKGLVVFVTANQLLSGKFRYHDPTFQPVIRSQLIPYYLLGTRWNKDLKGSFSNSLSLLLRSHQGLPLQPELSDIITWQDRFSLGVGYRFSYSTFAIARVRVTQDLLVGYSYELTMNGLNRITKGGHEINLSYLFGKQPKGSDSKKPSNKAINELYEELDKVDQKVEESNKRVDTLDKNVQKLNDEMKEVKKKSLNQEEIKKLVDSLKLLNPSDPDNNAGPEPKGKKRFGSIVSYGDADKYKNTGKANYNVVYGVYKVYSSAKEYVKLLQRDHAISTELIQLGDGSNGYYYVVDKTHKGSTEEALQQLKQVRSDLSKKTEPVTNGLPWVLIIFE
ncbi:MAG: hypothetical protein K0S33_4149 [Bacteroidetes bacterium]|jgi:type IX secretion system PorP/SprF family membrane protein|nr:hypothetical protein [Bacteroidota bacterium]